MDTRKLILKISFGLNAVLIIAIAGLLVYQQRLIRQIPQNEEQAPPVAAISDTGTRPVNASRTAPVPAGGQEQLAAEVDNLRYQLEASEEELDMAREDLAKKQGGPGDISELITMEKKMQENPTLMNMRRREAESFLDQTHGALFERLGLSDDKLQALKTLLVDSEMQSMEVSLGLMDQSLSEEERKEIEQQLEDQNSELKKQLKELLGAENYETYESYEERQMERNFVGGPFNSLSADLGLSDEKEQELIDAMYEGRKEMQAEYDTDSPNETLGSDGPAPEEFRNRQLEIFDSYAESARDVLSESQAEQFETRINERKEMMKMNSFITRSGDDDSQ